MVSVIPSQPSEAAPLTVVTTEADRAERLRSSFALLSPADLAALVGVDERTLALWRAQEKGPDFVRLGRAIFYRRADVVAWTDSSAAKSGKTADAPVAPRATSKPRPVGLPSFVPGRE